ncbi:MAG: T9SS type A sorting domain-containing protein [Chitinophagales bacterium]|nr:T9SS type A sorting domain-containing protein [Chitinophagales bacterium]
MNWDSVLTRFLPVLKTVTSKPDFNNILDSIITAAGSMAIATTPPPTTLPDELKHNLNLNWFQDPVFSTTIQQKLDTIKNNFRPHKICWVDKNNQLGSYNGYLVFPFDTPMLNVITTQSYPSANDRLLLLFKYWNLINYFNPYNYVLDRPWDSSLHDYVVPFDTVSDSKSLYLLIEKLTTDLDDAHVEGFTYSSAYSRPSGYYMPPIRLIYADNNYVVAASKIPNVSPGDVLLSVDGKTTQQLEDSLKQYISAGNESVLRRELCMYIISKESSTNETLVLKDYTGSSYTVTLSCNIIAGQDYDFYRSNYYPVDSLRTIQWTTLPCDIGYVNISNLEEADVASMYTDLKNKSAIIFDLRKYPKVNYAAVNSLIQVLSATYAKLMYPDLQYPGTFYWQNHNSFVGTDPYQGKVVILINEQTQSHGEYYTMTLEGMPNAVKVGSQTAGADGNITYWNLTRDITTGFSSLGVFYGNKDSTQRIGIEPDSVVVPTIAGIRYNRDEVLEKGLRAAGCNLYVNLIEDNTFSMIIFPNPAHDMISIKVDLENVVGSLITIKDIYGRTVFKKTLNSTEGMKIDVSNFPKGVYMLSLESKDGNAKSKLVIN